MTSFSGLRRRHRARFCGGDADAGAAHLEGAGLVYGVLRALDAQALAHLRQEEYAARAAELSAATGGWEARRGSVARTQ